MAGGLKGSGGVLIDYHTIPSEVQCLRCHIGVQKDVAVLEVLDVRAGLEVLLEGVTTLVGWR